jgi:hypothetical protein
VLGNGSVLLAVRRGKTGFREGRLVCYRTSCAVVHLAGRCEVVSQRPVRAIKHRGAVLLSAALHNRMSRTSPLGSLNGFYRPRGRNSNRAAAVNDGGGWCRKAQQGLPYAPASVPGDWQGLGFEAPPADTDEISGEITEVVLRGVLELVKERFGLERRFAGQRDRSGSIALPSVPVHFPR